MRNNSIDFETTKKKNILVCGTEINWNPAAEITWALILGLYRNMKAFINNLYMVYKQYERHYKITKYVIKMIVFNYNANGNPKIC